MNENLQYSPVKLYLYSFVVDPLPTLGLGQQEGYIQFEVQEQDKTGDSTFFIFLFLIPN